jgi:TM2 domain-containing membrane protein YozV
MIVTIIKKHKMKTLKILGLSIFCLCLLVLTGFGIHEFLKDSTVPLVIKWGMIGLILGMIIVIISLIIERIKDNKNNKI